MAPTSFAPMAATERVEDHRSGSRVGTGMSLANGISGTWPSILWRALVVSSLAAGMLSPVVVLFGGEPTAGAALLAASGLALMIAALFRPATRTRSEEAGSEPERGQAGGGAVALPMPTKPDLPPQLAENAHAASARLFRAAYAGLDAQGRIRCVSEDFERLTQRAGSSLIGVSFNDLLHVVDRVACVTGTMTLKACGDRSDVSARLKCGTGGMVPVRLSIERGPDGFHVAARAIPTVVSGDAEAAIALEVADKMTKARAELLASVTHELRTPLNAILGFSDALESDLFGPLETERQRDYVGLIRRSGEHLLGVVDAVLDTARSGPGNFAIAPCWFPPARAIEATAALLRMEADRKGLELRVEIEEAKLLIEADERACRQILINLASNAIKFTQEGAVTLSCRVEGERAILEVSDSGIGIAPGDITRLCQPFVRLAEGQDPERPGTGLGLCLSRHLAELHGGDLTIISQIGAGTTVRVELPTQVPAARSVPANESIVARQANERIHAEIRPRQIA